MNSSNPNEDGDPNGSAQGLRPSWIIAIACLLTALIAVLLPRSKTISTDRSTTGRGPTLTNAGSKKIVGSARVRPTPGRRPATTELESAKTADEIVAEKVVRFGKKRRELVHAIARRSNREVPPEVEMFFDAIEGGNWEELHTRWKALADRSGQYDGSVHSQELDDYWPSILDAYGVAEQAHNWPAQQLLDYGNAALDSLRPGMVYVGGTDNGRWVPELLNETGDGEPHIMLTQNALADDRYLQFLNELYDGKMATLTKEDSQRIYREYTADVRQRYEHDQQFPDEPKQMRPGEVFRMNGDLAEVSGVDAVMRMNEKLLRLLIEKNPGLSFAMEESQPMPGLYANALPLGPLMELQSPGAANTLTAEHAAQSVDYWRAVTQNVLADPAATASTYALRSYSHDSATAANLLAAHNYDREAEQAYRLSSQLWPGNAEAAGGLATILARTGRADEARQTLDNFARRYPDQRTAIESYGGRIQWKLQ